MRRGLYWAGVLITLAVLAIGVTVAVRGYAKTSGPDGAVRGYFAALARSDAATALAYGDRPAGPHTLLTATVLREQQRIAPLRRFRIRATEQHGATGVVHVAYTLAFRGRPISVRADVRVHRAGGQWRLDRVALPTTLDAATAGQRESVVGAAVPAGPTLLFPGALPVRLDTPYLELVPAQDSVSFDAAPTTPIAVEPTPLARAAFSRAVQAEVEACVSGGPDPSCPLPDERSVPGSAHGFVTGTVPPASVRLAAGDPVGTLQFVGTVAFTGSYRRLNFYNRPVLHRGPATLAVQAEAYAVAPLRVRWIDA